MIRLKVFISSVQKELRAERIAVGGFLATDEFLSQCTVSPDFRGLLAAAAPQPQGLSLTATYEPFEPITSRFEPITENLSRFEALMRRSEAIIASDRTGMKEIEGMLR